jgi:O-antigen/teichoic acid export membrane protein
MTREAERYISIMTVPFVTVIVMFPTQCAGIILGGDFAGAGEPMRFLALGTLLTMLNSIPASQILAVNRPGTSAKLTFMNFLVYLGLLVVLVPASIFGIQMLGMSATGAGIANLIAVAVLLVVTRYTVYKLTGTGVNIRLVLHLLAAIVAGIALTILSDFLALTGWLSIVIYGITSCVVFAAVLILLKELTRKDLNYFLDVINIKEMRSYMSNELRNKNK